MEFYAGTLTMKKANAFMSVFLVSPKIYSLKSLNAPSKGEDESFTHFKRQ